MLHACLLTSTAAASLARAAGPGHNLGRALIATQINVIMMQAAASLWKAEAKEASSWESLGAGSHWLRWGQALSATEVRKMSLQCEEQLEQPTLHVCRHCRWRHRSPQALLGQALSLVSLLYLDGPPAAMGLLLGIFVTGKQRICLTGEVGQALHGGSCCCCCCNPWLTCDAHPAACWACPLRSERLSRGDGLHVS